MKIAVASGKGGTGKTTVTAALASIWPKPLVAVDMDVEAPNLHLFLHPEVKETVKATILVPAVDESKCTFCRACAELCQFKAISVLGSVVLLFTDMCHGCGGCLAVCPEKALSADQRELGEIVRGKAGNNDFLMGRLRIGEAMSPPLMREVKAVLETLLKTAPASEIPDVIIDAPPGVSCPAVNAVMDTDVIVLVTEPTPFGLYDLKLAYEAFLPLGKSMGVVINRAGLGAEDVYDFCRSKALPIWSELPFDQEIAGAYANGRLVTTVSDAMKTRFQQLAGHIRQVHTSSETGHDA